jgi:hypothetical protein
MSRVRILDYVFLPVIVILASGVAYLTFGILQSTATLESSYKIGGAFAGFIIAFGTLFSAYAQLRKTSGETEELQARIKELEGKLIRGAPCPRDFEPMVDERHRIVLAKPKSWKPYGGMIFDFVEELPIPSPADVVPARFNLRYVSVSRKDLLESLKSAARRQDNGAGGDIADELYKNFIKMTETSPAVSDFKYESVFIGAAPDRIKCLKVIAKQMCRVILNTDPVTGVKNYGGQMLTKEGFEREKEEAERMEAEKKMEEEERAEAEKRAKGARVRASKARAAAAAEPPPPPAPPKHAGYEVIGVMELWRMYVMCYHPSLEKLFFFEFSDDKEDFNESSAMFNQILESVRFLT